MQDNSASDLKIFWRFFPAFIFLITAFAVFRMGVFRKTGTSYFTWRGTFHADQAGYHVYLPALFIYNFDANQFPENFDSTVGRGFLFDLSKGKVLTKYSYPVALLQAPVFLTIHWTLDESKYKADGYSGPYEWVPRISAMIYFFLAMLFLFGFLKRHFSKILSLYPCPFVPL